MLLVSIIAPANDKDFISRVLKVIDGNTIEVIGTDNHPQKLVLSGIDSPEPGQTYSGQAKKLLEKILLQKEVRVRIEGKTRRGDYLAVVTLVKNQLDPRVMLLEEGLAWTAENNPLPELEYIRVKAREKGKGLWKETDPTPPWVFRRQQSMLQPKSS